MSELITLSIRPELPSAGMQANPVLTGKFRAPRLTQLPKGTPPGSGLVLSMIVHAAGLFALLTWLPLLFPSNSAVRASVAAEDFDQDRQVIYFPVLPRVERKEAGSHIESASNENEKVAPSAEAPKAEVGQSKVELPKPDFAGPQVIVSDLPDASNNVQTIRRPDLDAPAKFANPIRLKSMVMLPAHVPTAPAAPQAAEPVQPLMPNPVEPATFNPSQPRLQIPVVPMGAPIQKNALPKEAVAPEIAETFHRALPAFSPDMPSPPKAVIVMNAVNVPADAASSIPDAEVSGKFIVGPSTTANAKNTPSPASVTKDAAVNTPIDSINSARANAGNSSHARIEINGGRTGPAPSGSITISGGRPGPGDAGSDAGSGNGSMPGISISGATTYRAGAVNSTTTNPHGSYGITIMSGGNSGGASRDLGVFSRNDTVYTVYVPMGDTGGGPDWPIEYALANAGQASYGLLTPPVVVKKMRATGLNTDSDANSEQVFVAGIIDESGKLQGLRAIHASDGKSRSALIALAQWEFLPARLDGKAVASKVLIGVSLTPGEEIGKRE